MVVYIVEGCEAVPFESPRTWIECITLTEEKANEVVATLTAECEWPSVEYYYIEKGVVE